MCVPSFDVRVIVMRCCCVLLVTTAVMLWLYLRPSLALPSLLLSQIASTVRAAGIVRERHSPISLLKSGIRHDRNMILQQDNAMEDKQGNCDETQSMLRCAQTCNKNIWILSEQFMSSLRNIEWEIETWSVWHWSWFMLSVDTQFCHELSWIAMNSTGFILMCHRIM